MILERVAAARREAGVPLNDEAGHRLLEGLGRDPEAQL
jgi:hypothetical protein